jgi:hypothetical protein
LVNLSAIERKALATGPPVKFMVGEKVIAKIPRALFVATSSMGTARFDTNSEVHLSSGYDEASTDCLAHLVHWLEGTTKHNKVHPLRAYRDLTKAIKLYHVAKDVGFMRYINNTMVFFKVTIRDCTPSKRDLEAVENLCTDSKDSFLNMFADRIAYLIRKKQVDAEYLARVSTFPNVDKAVHEHNSDYEERQVRAANARAAAARRQRAKEYREHLERKARREAAEASHLAFLDRQARREARGQSGQCGQSYNKNSGNSVNQKQGNVRRRNQQTYNGLLAKVNQKVLLTAEERDDAMYYKFSMKDPAFASVS